MVLYEDLRIYTIWRTDMARSAADASSPNSPNNTYHKSAEEWEILGDLAERLHHDQEAVEAYQHCLRVRFSPKAMKGVMAWYEKQGKYGDVLQAIIRLIAWQYRWYSEVCDKVHDVWRCSSNGCNSFRPTSSARCANSSRMKGRSRCAVLCRRRAYLSLYWISHIIMWSNVRRSGVVAATVEALSKVICYIAQVLREALFGNMRAIPGS